jgi:glucose/mannose transport system substrate-binding protein
MKSTLIAGAPLALALLTGCGGSGGSTATTSQEVEIFSWWTSGGEADALTAMLNVHYGHHANVDVINAAIKGSANARSELKVRMQGGQPPDTFQANGGQDMLSWVTFNAHDDADSKMENIDFLAASQGWLSSIPEVVRQTVSYNGHFYAVPVNIHRINSLFYNKKMFDDNALVPPTTMAEFYQVGDALKAKGIIPLAVGSKGPWTLTELALEDVLPAVAGGAYYRDFLSGKKNPADAEFRSAIEEVAKVFEYMNVDANTLNWDEGVNLVYSGKAGMTIMGDWAKGYLINAGWKAGVDFGEVPMPGTVGTFVFTTDTFGLPKGAPNRPATIDLLTTFGSVEGQDAFNPIKGSIPSRSDIDKARYDTISQKTIDDFASNTLVPAAAILAPATFSDPVNDAMGKFQNDKNVDNVIFVVRNHYDILQAQAR